MSIVKIDTEYVRKFRRQFHMHPELSMKEELTSHAVQEALQEMGAEVEIVPPLGVIGILRGKQPGKTIVLRADMDALPMQESEENLYQERKTVLSKVPGVAHTCGHDAHTAMLLGAAKALCQMKESFDGTVLCCFEQAEETGQGWDGMLKALSKYPVDAGWALHTRPSIPVGKMALIAGPSSAGAMGFDVEIKGRGCHGAELYEGIDPIMCGVHLLEGLQDLVTRRVYPGSPAVLSVGKFQAGHAPNIIPETARIAGTMRFFSRENGEVMKEGFQQILDGTCQAFRCTYSTTKLIDCVPLINDPHTVDVVSRALSQFLGDGNLIPMEPLMGSESFANYAEKFPCAYGYLGIDTPGRGVSAMPHQPKFDIDETCLDIGAGATVHAALALLNA